MKDIDEFYRVTQTLLEDTEEFISKKQLKKLKSLAINDKKAFVKYYKKVSGATDWDLPNIVYSFS